jgi:hypothetical protein
MEDDKIIIDADQVIKPKNCFLSVNKFMFVLILQVLKRMIVFFLLFKISVALMFANMFYFNVAFSLSLIPLCAFEVIGYFGLKLLKKNLVMFYILMNCQVFCLGFVILANFNIIGKFKKSIITIMILFMANTVLLLMFHSRLKKMSQKSIKKILEAIRECSIFIQY